MPETLKIAFDAKRIFNNSTGLGNYGRALLQNLIHYYPQHQYHLFTPTQPNHHLPVRANCHSPQTHSPHPLLKPFWRSYTISKYIKKSGAQIYHGLSNELPIGLKNTKTVVTIHDLIFKVLPNTYPFIDRQIYNFKFRYACQKADMVIAISESTKNDIIQHYGIDDNKIEVIYQSCHPSYYDEAMDDETSNIDHLNLPNEYLLSVGALAERKNVLLILKALRMMPETHRIPLVIVGKGKRYKKILNDYIQQYQLQKWVIFLEQIISLEQLQILYRKADLVVYPSLYEGFGLPVVEGLLCKTPVITSNLSSLPEAGGPDTVYINPQDAEDLKEAILHILSDTQKRQRMIEKGYQYATASFHPKVVTNQLEDTYQRLITE